MLTKIVYNPNFIRDTIYLLDLKIHASDLKKQLASLYKKKPTDVEKLITLVDRIEFIKHLQIISEHASSAGFQLNGNEVVGVDHDIAALRLYLALTCVDIFSTNFEQFHKWILKNTGDIQDGEQIVDVIKRKSEEYDAKFQLSSNFVGAFLKSPFEIRSKLQQGIKVVTKSGSLMDDIDTIAHFLYGIRNKYTHEGRRFHHYSKLSAYRIQAIGLRNPDALMISPGFDLVAVILDVSIAQVRQKLDLY